MRERVLAIVGAIALVAVALVARSFLADDEGTGGGRDGSRPVVACTKDLMAVCDALAEDGRIADDPPTLDLDTKDEAAAAGKVGDRELDGWITWDGTPGVADIDASEAGRVPSWGEARPVGTSPLAVATSDGLTLPDGCDFDALVWSCLLEAAEDDLAVGVGTGRTAESLSRLYPIALALAGGESFRDIDGARVRAVVQSPRDAVGREAYAVQVDSLITKRGALNLVVAPIGKIREAAMSGFAVEPAASMTAVVVGRADGELDLTSALASARVTAAIKKLGLTVDPGAELAPEDRAGELYALREKVG